MSNKIDFTTLTSEDFSDKVTFNIASPAHYLFRKTGNLVQFSYQSAGRTWSTNTTVFTLPTGYRPASTQNEVWFVGSFNDQKPCQCGINITSGAVIASASSTSNVRLYVAGSYFVA